jgi:hypothetical protein
LGDLCAEIGITGDDLVEMWRLGGLTPPAQKALYLAAKYVGARNAVKQITPASKPRVQKPGSGHDHPDVDEAEISRMESALDKAKGLEQIRLAANLVAARRRQRSK